MENLVSMIGYAVVAVLGMWLVLWVLGLRTVVPTNEVHIAQRGMTTVPYGRGEAGGNVYYRWPVWLPRIGIKVITLPVSVFDVDLDGYAAYDKGRLPFIVDIMAFFRVTDPAMAAQRVVSISELSEQLQGILQGACRSILASHDIEEILEGRSQFGDRFTKEVDHQLVQWGVQSVKQIELMDLRDSDGSHVIAQIMAKKKSVIEMQSRVEVAANRQKAETAEIEATQAIEIRRQDAVQTVGQRTADQEREVGISKEKASQSIKEEQRVTMTRQMAVKQVEIVKGAEIEREKQVIIADQDRQIAIVQAEGLARNTVITAEASLTQAKLSAEGVRVQGEAEGSAKLAVEQVPVDLQIRLAEKIGEDEGYQDYLIKIRTVEKEETVGVAQAAALQKADIKVIAQAGSAPSGIEALSDVMSTKGGMALGSALEALANTPIGNAVVKRITGGDKAAA